MINIERNQPAPLSLAEKKMTGVKEVLVGMFFDKCYLCEDKRPIPTEIEHFKPKSKYPDDEFIWDNLLLACHHCNAIKNTTTDIKDKEILNCTKLEKIITTEIKFIAKPHPKEKVRIEKATDTDEEILENTVHLLHEIYNCKTESRLFDAANLSNKVNYEIKILVDLINEYYWANKKQLKDNKLELIKDNLSKESPFTAFKIWYVNEHESLKEFEEFLPKFEW